MNFVLRIFARKRDQILIGLKANFTRACVCDILLTIIQRGDRVPNRIHNFVIQ